MLQIDLLFKFKTFMINPIKDKKLNKTGCSYLLYK